MPRKQRIEFPGAVYHIVSRGNYRKALFLEPGSGGSFEKALFEVAERCRWRIYAYVIMSNHYHLALETPEANLVAGMKWLQGTFATRFNRSHRENGHVFQGRYKSLVVEDGRPLLGLINYIHLNPVRAGLCTVDDLRQFKLSSYHNYWKKSRPGSLDRRAVLSLADLSDSATGMRAYERMLELVDESKPSKRVALQKQYCRGWFLGSGEAKRSLAKDLAKAHPDATWTGRDLRELNEEKWEMLTRAELKRRNKNGDDVKRDLKGSPWKLEVARSLRRNSTASNPWIALRLNMGHPTRVSIAIGTRRC